MRGPAGPAGHARSTREEDGMTSGEHHDAAPTLRDPYAGAYAGSVPASGTNRLAIVSLVLSLAGLVTYGLTSIVGIVLGHLARGQITRTGEQGAGLALAGIIVGYSVVGLLVIATVIVLVTRTIMAAA